MEQQSEYVTEALEMLEYKEPVRVKDESGDKKYFTITPRIVKSLSRNAYDFAVWDTIKDIAGESGECFLNTDQIAILSGCSAGQVSKSRKYWLKIGFLKGNIRKDPGYSQAVWHLTVPDLWQKNVEWCEKYPKITDRLAFREAHRSLHTVKPSHSEGKPSHSETKKNLIKNNNLTTTTTTPAPIFEADAQAQAAEALYVAITQQMTYPATWEESYRRALSDILTKSFAGDITAATASAKPIFSRYCNTRSEGGTKYRPTGTGWLDWWQAELAPAPEGEGQKKTERKQNVNSNVPKGVSVAQSWLAKKQAQEAQVGN